MKIVSSGNTISTTEYLKRKRKERRRKRFIYTACFLVFCIGAILLLRLDKFQIENIEVEGALVTGNTPVELVARDVLSGNYLWLVPRGSVVLYPRSTVEKILLRKFPRFSSVGVRLTSLQTLSITAIEREPFALYCASGTCYFLDESGFIFDTAPTFSEGVYFTYTTAEPVSEPFAKELIPTSEFRPLSDFVERLKDFGVKPLSLHIGDEDERVALENGATIVLPRKGDLTLTFSNLEAFLSSEAIKNQKDFWNKLELLDVRTDNKVFYTLRE